MNQKNFIPHTPDLTEDEPGLAWEKTMWGDYLPKWSNSPEDAEFLATEIVTSVMNNR
jgi:hypothetical protein